MLPLVWLVVKVEAAAEAPQPLPALLLLLLLLFLVLPAAVMVAPVSRLAVCWARQEKCSGHEA